MSGAVGQVTVAGAVQSLLSRHGVEGVPSLLSEEVRTEFERATKAGLTALTAELSAREQGAVLFRASYERFEQFVKSPEVATELSKLLDPGFEVIDTVALTHSLAELLTEPDSEKRIRLASDAWKAFFRGFSFASRSSPDLREFIRASYEAGTFRAISNISDAIESLDRNVTDILRHERDLQASMRDYARELAVYRDWARTARKAS